jgi:hypothetical protein
LFSASRTVITVNATHFASGDIAGALSVVTLYQSPGANARGAFAGADGCCAASGEVTATSESIANGR